MKHLRTSLFIARRYFFSRKGTHAVHIIAIVAICGITLVTAAMVCVLSIFNGFEEFTTGQLSALSPNARIQRCDGKVFSYRSVLERLEGEPIATSPELTVEGLLRYGANPLLGTLVGIDSSYLGVVPLHKFVFDGEFDTGTTSHPCAVIGIGVGASLGAGAGYADPLEVVVPKRIGRLSATLPARSFRTSHLPITGVFRVDQPEDAHRIYLDIGELRHLLQYEGDEVTSIALTTLTPSVSLKRLSRLLGQEYQVPGRVEQHAEIYKVLKLEKWISFALLLFILLLSLFSVISTLGMLIIEKRQDAVTLHHIGAPPRMLRLIILLQGGLLTCTGLVSGMLLGVSLSLGQQHFGWIKLGGDSSGVFLLEAYPVRLLWSDLIGITLVILAVGWSSSYLAYRLFGRQQHR